MIKKLFLITVTMIILFGANPVTDAGTYKYLLQQIKQYTEMINSLNEQVKSLAGIRTVIDDTKRNIYDAKDTLENSILNLRRSADSLMRTMESTEIKSLFSIRRDSIGNSTGGIMSEDIQERINAYFQKADDVLVERMGGEKKLKQISMNLYRINKALKQTNLNDFNAVINSKPDYDETKKSIQIKEFIRDNEKLLRNTVKEDAYKNVQEKYNEIYYPSEEQKKEKEDELKRLTDYVRYIKEAKNLNEQSQTTNLILIEILKILQKEYQSAITYRNAVATQHLLNINNPAYLARLVENAESLQEEIKNFQPTNDVNDEFQKLKKANSLGIGLRF
jgi:glutaredoxin-related protein